MKNEYGISVAPHRFHISITQNLRNGEGEWAWSVSWGTSVATESIVALGYAVDPVDAAKMANKAIKAAIKRGELS